jgi:hypothetical protein
MKNRAREKNETEDTNGKNLRERSLRFEVTKVQG